MADPPRATASLKDALAHARGLLEREPALAAAQAREILQVAPEQPDAALILGVALGRLGDLEGAAAVLAPLVEARPEAAIARYELALVLYRLGRPAAASPHLQDALTPMARYLRGAVLMALGEPERAAADFHALAELDPRQPGPRLSLGHALKELGRTGEAAEAYRRALTIAPGLGEAWWSLANLKTFRFSDADLAAMQALAARPTLSPQDRIAIGFALGKALEDAGDPAAAFACYQRGNAARRAGQPYDAAGNTAFVRRSIDAFTPALFAARAGQGDPATDPIFILGLPRSGSTLVEQILASHSKVEGVGELPDLTAIARRVAGVDPNAYPACLASLGAADLAALGAEYLERTRPMRKLGRPLFIDKFPSNFLHVGLIRLILPNAKIVDARRHPMACCFSAYKQLFAEGQAYSYDLADLGRYYRDYVELMAHFDAVQPGRMHRVIYERLVEDPDREIRSLLAYCGLDFEQACLDFHRTVRPVRTASAAQVRRPLFKDAVDHWRAFEPWLGALREALGPVIEAWAG
ncbi:tetratricopeptide repeat-containing sulfotransferase family protein [Phenylobacterium montanum]|uniref:Sulfotransferase n=1 Tax=Phenylobacterium montanum TaxID=2823693 RepID=A0A975FYN6_9CAUL|nr:sulfotransferase [Caulobacter sp. S6]QUD87883.1 sulfotransferase [Caulobacter sp. S6]